MKFLSREDILVVDDLTYKDIEVKEWGGWVRIRTLRGIDRAKLISYVTSSDDGAPTDWIERLIIACTTDEKGKQLFTMKDIAELGKKNSVILQRLFDAADELNTITAARTEAIKGE